eukprot:12134428-Karenia_brevis.AAC.1
MARACATCCKRGGTPSLTASSCNSFQDLKCTCMASHCPKNLSLKRYTVSKATSCSPSITCSAAKVCSKGVDQLMSV